LKRKDILFKSDKLNKDSENKKEDVKKKKTEVSKKIDLLYYKLNQFFIIS
jgi:hypothetical protein